MDLNETLYLIATQLKIDGDKLIEYAAEDTETGWDHNLGAWPIGSLWAVEGKTLYALVRYFQPGIVIEIGTHHGCSAAHITNALQANDNGVLFTVDLNQRLQSTDWLEAVAADGVGFLKTQDDDSVSMIWEDADHTLETCRDVALEAMRVLRPGGLLVMHDAQHRYVGATVRAGLEETGINYRVYLADPSDCGLAIWQKPGLPKTETPVLSDDKIETIYEALQDKLAEKKPLKTSTRGRKPRKAKVKA